MDVRRQGKECFENDRDRWRQVEALFRHVMKHLKHAWTHRQVPNLITGLTGVREPRARVAPGGAAEPRVWRRRWQPGHRERPTPRGQDAWVSPAGADRVDGLARPALAGDVVVVGVDGSPASYTALRWALTHAARTGSRVHAIRC